MNPLQLELRPIGTLVPHEHVDESRVTEVARAALRSGSIDFPILAGDVVHHGKRGTLVIDGHHRLMAADKFLRLECVPAYVFPDYLNDPRITVDAWRLGEMVTKADVVYAAMAGQLMPIKTSRHRANFEMSPRNVPLSLLRQSCGASLSPNPKAGGEHG